MPRSYRHIKDYEQEILKLKSQGLTKREIGARLGFTYEQVHDFISRHNKNQRKFSAGAEVWTTVSNQKKEIS